MKVTGSSACAGRPLHDRRGGHGRRSAWSSTRSHRGHSARPCTRTATRTSTRTSWKVRSASSSATRPSGRAGRPGVKPRDSPTPSGTPATSRRGCWSSSRRPVPGLFPRACPAPDGRRSGRGSDRGCRQPVRARHRLCLDPGAGRAARPTARVARTVLRPIASEPSRRTDGRLVCPPPIPLAHSISLDSVFPTADSRRRSGRCRPRSRRPFRTARTCSRLA